MSTHDEPTTDVELTADDATGADEESASPYVMAIAEVESVERISPSFVRITFSGEGVSRFGNPGATFDQRIKLVFPGPGGPHHELVGDPEWWTTWSAIPDDERGAVRTYSLRDVVVDGPVTRLVIDFVLHLVPGLTGPASTWASTAAPGDALLIAGPVRGRGSGGGIEYLPGDAREVVLVGDETAAPAIARILEDADPATRGLAFIEVPVAEDAFPIDAPAGVRVQWIARDGVPHGAALMPIVLDALDALDAELPEIADIDSEDLLWETPVYSGLGEAIEPAAPHADRYFWIAGESGVVTTLRRQLVKQIGVARSQVSLMGYWRKGVAMRG